MFDLSQWIMVQYPKYKQYFQWVEVASCPNPLINGEILFAKHLYEINDFDVLIDVGASNSPYVQMFPDKEIILFDVRGLDAFHNNITVINNFVGTNKKYEKLCDYISEDKKYFIKIDVNGFEEDVIKTINKTNYDNIICLQFEYDIMWKESFTIHSRQWSFYKIYSKS